MRNLVLAAVVGLVLGVAAAPDAAAQRGRPVSVPRARTEPTRTPTARGYPTTNDSDKKDSESGFLSLASNLLVVVCAVTVFVRWVIGMATNTPDGQEGS